MRARLWSLRLAGVVLLAAAVAGCVGSPTYPSTGVYSQTDLVVGNGTEATAGKTITMDYTGWLWDPSKSDLKGPQFASSIGGTPLTFVLGAGQVIPGWERGVPGMQVGGVRRLVIPPSLAYGATRSGLLPPNATLVFEITLLDVQ